MRKKIQIVTVGLGLFLLISGGLNGGTEVNCPSGDRYKCYTVTKNGNTQTWYKGQGETTLRRVPVPDK